MAGLDTNGDGFMDMEPGMTKGAIDAFTQATSAFTGVWNGKQGDIDGKAAALGKPHLGEEFKNQYDPLANWVKETMAQAVPALAKLGEVGNQAVTDYQAADAANQSHVQPRQ